jgi:glycosyltransferase involved in cell wall biosynthesis
MSKKSKILIFADYFLPGYKAGGPITTLSNIINSLSNDFEFDIITRNHDLGEAVPYKGISKSWNTFNNYRVLYLDDNPLMALKIYRCLNNNNCTIYLNSFFSFYFSIWVLILLKLKLINPTQIILAPRGELHANALNYKKIKKNIFLFIKRKIHLHYNVIWQASSEVEKCEIQKVLSYERIKVIQNIPDLIDYNKEIKYRIKEPDKVKIIFLSRVHPTKNLKFALEVLRQLDGQVEFDIYGPIEVNNYWDKCVELIGDMPSSIKITYWGPLEKRKITNTLEKYHLLLFPTQNENFGHVIAEALSASVPVIISDKTPWRDLSKYKAGYDLPLNNPEKFISALKLFQSMNQNEYNDWVQGTRDFLKENYNYENIRKQYYELFTS